MALVVAGILLLIALVSLGFFLRTVIRRWREIRLLDPETIREEMERRKRDELIAKRFERITAERVAPFRLVGMKVGDAIKKRARALHLSVIRLEKYYKQAKAPLLAMSPSARDRIKVLSGEARSLARDLKWAESERKYLEVLGLDARHWDAYKGLGQIYLDQQLYAQAKETFTFLLNSKKADDAVFAALADIAEHEQHWEEAELNRKKAVQFRPRLANRQAELAQFYVERDQPALAWPAAKLATELDAKSVRYLELSVEVAILLRDRTEARQRYDRLRLLSQDRPKLQSLKERIDGIG